MITVFEPLKAFIASGIFIFTIWTLASLREWAKSRTSIKSILMLESYSTIAISSTVVLYGWIACVLYLIIYNLLP